MRCLQRCRVFRDGSTGPRCAQIRAAEIVPVGQIPDSREVRLERGPQQPCRGHGQHSLRQRD